MLGSISPRGGMLSLTLIPARAVTNSWLKPNR
jgi:hypothetical protein